MAILVVSKLLQRGRCKLGTWYTTPCSQLRTALYSTVPLPNVERHGPRMCAWQIHSYGGLEQLRLSTVSKVPKLRSPDDVLIEVCASSVNPIDIAMMGGYGSVLLRAMRQVENCTLSVLEFPLSLGRDFSGKVIAKGYRVDNLKVGDEVWGVLPPHQQGCHAEKVIVNKKMVQLKPKCLTHAEAGSMLYTGITAWSALKITGDLFLTPAKGKKVLLLGGSGGVGTAALQLLKVWGAQVVTTCRNDAIPLMESFGADVVIDYTQEECESLIKKEGRYDIILDAAGMGSEKGTEFAQYLKDFKFSKYITLRSPLLRNLDEFGIVGGMVKNFIDLAVPNIRVNLQSTGSTIRWGFFFPIPDALQEIQYLVEERKLVPVVEKIYSFSELPMAYERVMQGHMRGKAVIDFQNKESKDQPIQEGE